MHVLLFGTSTIAWGIGTPRGLGEEIISVRLEGLELGEMNNIREIIKPEIVEDEPTDEPDEPENIGDDETQELTPEASADAAVEDVLEDILPDFDAEPETEPVEPDADELLEELEVPEETPITQNRSAPKEPSIDDLLGDIDESLNQDVRSQNVKRSGSRATRELEDQGQTANQGAAGAGTGNTATLLVLLKAQIEENQCWRSTSDLPDWESLDVTIRFRLDDQGRLISGPERIRPKFISASDRFMRVASERAIRAINLCAPFDLPPEQFALWRDQDIQLTFDEQF